MPISTHELLCVGGNRRNWCCLRKKILKLVIHIRYVAVNKNIIVSLVWAVTKILIIEFLSSFTFIYEGETWKRSGNYSISGDYWKFMFLNMHTYLNVRLCPMGIGKNHRTATILNVCFAKITSYFTLLHWLIPLLISRWYSDVYCYLFLIITNEKNRTGRCVLAHT